MGFAFNPIGENDWQGLNIMLEQLFYQKAQAVAISEKTSIKQNASGEYIDGLSEDDDQDEEISPTPTPTPTPEPTPTKKELRKKKIEERRAAIKARREARKKKVVLADSSYEYPDGTPIVPSTNTVAVVGSQGMEVYTAGAPTENITLPKDSVVYKTAAKVVVPYTYYKNLVCNIASTSVHQISASYLVVSDSNSNTIALQNVYEQNDVDDVQTASVAGKRDQSAAFTASTWVYFYIIYNPTTNDISSLSSASATAPTLPSGYTHYARVSVVRFNSSSQLVGCTQIGNTVYLNSASSQALWDTGPVTADTLEYVDLSAIIPPTARVVTGAIGASSNATGNKGVAVSSNSIGTVAFFEMSINPANPVSGYGLIDPFVFTIPTLSPTYQYIWWTASTNASIYGMYILSFQDDL